MTTTFYGLMDPDTAVAGSHPAVTLTDALDETVYQQIYFPTLMATLNSVKVFVVPAASGDMSCGCVSNWGRVCAGALANEGVGTIVQHIETLDIDEIECIDITAAFTGVLAGSIGGLAFTRYGTAAADTVNANCFYLGIEVNYS